MTFAYKPDEKTAKRVRAIVPKLTAGATDALRVQKLESAEISMSVFAVLAGWWRFANRTADAMLALYDQGFTVEVTPLMRNLVGHAYAINWLADHGEAGYRALMDESHRSRKNLLENLEQVGWELPEEVELEAPDFGFTTPDQKKEHDRRVGELRTFQNMVTAYGSPMLYPVYRNLSAYAHTTDLTASAFVSKVTDDEVVLHETSHADRLADLCWMPVPLLQAASVMSPLLQGDPMRKLIREASRDLGLPEDLAPRRP
ncbi:DUF5677 domain-containing protein [Streptomyces sp. NPDC085937]|uniref:DUF5677 domain-containing protein n=1 Tax=Streptomyces sp. NPDC085937 TaxID=3365742 RepID=UPI0037D2ACA0